MREVGGPWIYLMEAGRGECEVVVRSDDAVGSGETKKTTVWWRGNRVNRAHSDRAKKFGNIRTTNPDAFRHLLAGDRCGQV